MTPLTTTPKNTVPKAMSFPLSPVCMADNTTVNKPDLVDMIATVVNEGYNEEARCDIYRVVLSGTFAEVEEVASEHSHFILESEVRTERLGLYANGQELRDWNIDQDGAYENIHPFEEVVGPILYELSLQAVKTAYSAGW